jgi:hypothetical protein
MDLYLPILCHLIQSVHRVPPVFFLEAKRYREPPFWRHKSLKAIEDAAADAAPEPVDGGDEDDDDEYEEHNDEEEEEEGYVGTYEHDGQIFEETMQTEIDLIIDFVKGLKHQVQFRDQRMLNTLQREGASFLRLARACTEKERRLNSTRSAAVSTWEQSTSNTMFYRTRPTRVDHGT